MHHVPLLKDQIEPMLLRRIRPERNERRFYAMTVAADLFGNILLVRWWGRIGTEGRQRDEVHNDLNSAAQSFERLMRTKRRRGYSVDTATPTTPRKTFPPLA